MSTHLRDLFIEALESEPIASPAADEDVLRGRRARTRRRWQGAGVVGAVAATTAAALLPISPVSLSADDPTFGPAGGADCANDPIDDEKRPPRILPDVTTYPITAVNEEDPWVGTMYIQTEGREIEFDWGQPERHQELLRDRRTESTPSKREDLISVLGCQGSLFIYGDNNFEVFWLMESTSYRIQYGAGDFAEFVAFLDGLRKVDMATWTAAMPEHYIPVHDNSAVLAAIADAVPMTDDAVARARDHINHIDPRNERALLEESAHWAMCGWVKTWILGNLLDHDPASAAKAAENMPVVRTWAEDNDAVTDDLVWDYADAIINGKEGVNGEAWTIDHAADIRCGGF